MSIRNRRLLFMTAVIIFTLSAAAAALAADIPPQLTVSDLERVDFSRVDTAYRALFPGVPEDREKIARLVELYNRALPSLGPEFSLDEELGTMTSIFLNRVGFSLTDGRSVTLVLYKGVSLDTGTLAQSRRVTDPEMSKELEKALASAEVTSTRRGRAVTVPGRKKAESE